MRKKDNFDRLREAGDYEDDGDWIGVRAYSPLARTERNDTMTNFEKIKSMTVEELAAYIFANCDNPLYECNEDMCDICERGDNGEECTDEYCIKSLVKMLNSEVGK